MNAGRTFGAFFLFIGLAFTVVGYSTYAGGGTFKVLLFGPAILLGGLSMMFYPGTKYTNKQLRTKEIDANDVIYKAPLKAKIIWVIGTLIGVIISTAFREELASLF